MPAATESPQLRHERIAGLVVAALLCLAAPTVLALVHDGPGDDVRPESVYWFLGAAVAGGLLPFAYWSPNRALGFVPIAALAWLVAVLASAFTGAWPGAWPGWAHGLPVGVALGSAVRGRRGPEPAEETTGLFAAVALGVLFAWAITSQGRPFDAGGYLVVAISVVLFLWSWTRLFRPFFEVFLEPPVWLAYRIRGVGPGLADFPRTGPCVVIANHACWFDPLFIAKVIPRPVTPMMTARFYDLPVLRRLMVMFGVIRVPEKALRKEAPELQEAVAALDRGECVVLFPEGYLRRGEDAPLRRFGQGIWQILKARPGTPVFACWIEGAWGSYTSYLNGKPTKNKRPDFRRRIAVGVSAPVTVPAEILADHLQTRFHLMNHVSAARLHVGLTALPPFEAPAKSETAEDGTDANEVKG